MAQKQVSTADKAGLTEMPSGPIMDWISLISSMSRIRIHRFSAILCLMPCGLLATTPANDAQLEAGKRALRARTGCYLVDYSFVETEAMKEGYVRDNRVYDVNRDKSVKEWIFAEDLSPTRIKLQHVLFATDLSGKMKEDSLLKHTGEDWEFNAPFLYEYSGHFKWAVKDLKTSPNLWTRRVTSLDDGLRYQCAAAFLLTNSYSDWSCENYAPIPGRETRDMSRKDYQGLQRTSRLISYGSSWLERERNVKTVETGETRTPLVKEAGKTWYVRLPDSECAAAQSFVNKRLAFWMLLTQTWDQVLNGKNSFEEPQPAPHPSRYEKIMEVEEQYMNKDLADPGTRGKAQASILNIIQRSPNALAAP